MTTYPPLNGPAIMLIALGGLLMSFIKYIDTDTDSETKKPKTSVQTIIAITAGIILLLIGLIMMGFNLNDIWKAHQVIKKQ
jgi:hypothetical protein